MVRSMDRGRMLLRSFTFFISYTRARATDGYSSAHISRGRHPNPQTSKLLYRSSSCVSSASSRDRYRDAHARAHEPQRRASKLCAAPLISAMAHTIEEGRPARSSSQMPTRGGGAKRSRELAQNVAAVRRRRVRRIRLHHRLPFQHAHQREIETAAFCWQLPARCQLPACCRFRCERPATRRKQAVLPAPGCDLRRT